MRAGLKQIGGTRIANYLETNVTVAAVIERDGKFLLVEEETTAGIRFNQPADIWIRTRPSSLPAAAKPWKKPGSSSTALIGVYTADCRLRSDLSALCLLRRTGSVRCPRKLDTGILRAVWLSYDEIRACRERHRSPLVLRCIEDYLAGKRFRLELITEFSPARSMMQKNALSSACPAASIPR